MTETHKAAVEALETMPSNRIYGGIKSATQFKKELGEWAFNNLDALRTIKQPSSVEVTDISEDDARLLVSTAWKAYSMQQIMMGKLPTAEDEVDICIKTLVGLRITRAAATDGVKS